jgi:hypothetical protein
MYRYISVPLEKPDRDRLKKAREKEKSPETKGLFAARVFLEGLKILEERQKKRRKA